MSRPEHPSKEIEAAVVYAEAQGWRVRKSAGRAHAWGRMYCPQATREGCQVSIYSTPRSDGNHARHLVREVDKCPHGDVDDDL